MWKKREEMDQVQQRVSDETRGEWMTFGMRKEYNTTQTS